MSVFLICYKYFNNNTTNIKKLWAGKTNFRNHKVGILIKEWKTKMQENFLDWGLSIDLINIGLKLRQSSRIVLILKENNYKSS